MSEELDRLNAKLAASEGRPGYEGRVEAIKAEIAGVDAEAEAEGEDDGD
jgi:hypothetical protein